MDLRLFAPLLELRAELQKESNLLLAGRNTGRAATEAGEEHVGGLMARMAGPALAARARAIEAMANDTSSTTAVAEVLREAIAPLPMRIERPPAEQPPPTAEIPIHEEYVGRRLLRRALGKDRHFP